MDCFAFISRFERGYLGGGADKMRDIRLAEVSSVMRHVMAKIIPDYPTPAKTVVAEFSFLRNDLIELMRKVPKCTFTALMELNGTIFAG